MDPMTNPADLATWLLEQIAEDERIAQDGSPLEAVTAHKWRVIDTEEQGPGVGKMKTRMVVAGARPSLVARLGTDRERRVSTHIVTWDPRRVLAECDAKRQMVQSLSNWARFDMTPVQVQGASREEWYLVSLARSTLKQMALPYVDRPGYRDEWRP